MTQALALPAIRITDANGDPISGAKAYFYATGTTTPQTVYTNSALSIAHANPVVANSAGTFAPIFLDPTKVYRLVVKDASDVAIPNWDIDPINGSSAANIQYQQAGTGAVVRTAQDKLREGLLSVKDFGATGNGTTDDTAAINLAIAQLSAGKTLYFPAGDYKVSVSGAGLFGTAAFAIPAGANVFMEPGAWIKPVTSLAVIVFEVGGRNIMQVNVDGQSLPELSTVQSADWINDSFGIVSRSVDEGTVINSRFRNLEYGLYLQGPSKWKIIANRFERIKLSGVLFEQANGHDCMHNLVDGCDFKLVGDTFVAFHYTPATTEQCAFNTVANCTGKDHNLRTQGFAYDVEQGDPALQHHNLFIGNSAIQTQTGLGHGTGLAVMNACSDSAIIGNIGKSAQGTNADFGVSMLSSQRCLISNNVLTGYRGAGAIVDGCSAVDVLANTFVDCGGNSGGVDPVVLIAYNLATSHVRVANNRIFITSSYSYASDASQGIAVSAGTGSPTGDVANVSIDNNVIVTPWGIGFYGLATGGKTLKNLNITNNRVIRNNTGSTPAAPFRITGAEQVTIADNILKDCGYGPVLAGCTGVTLRDGEMKGTATVAELYNFGFGGSNCTGVRVRDMRCYQTVTTVIATAGTGTTYLNDDKVVTDNKGTTAAIATGATVNHGLSSTPANVQITPQDSGPTDWYVSAKGATTFTINYSGGGTHAFDWRAVA